MKARLRAGLGATCVLGASAALVWLLVAAFGGERVVARLLFWGFVLVAWLAVSALVALGLGAVLGAADAAEEPEPTPSRKAA